MPYAPLWPDASSKSTRRTIATSHFSTVSRISSLAFVVSRPYGVRATSRTSTHVVGGHLRYQYVIGSIPRELHWEDLDRDLVDRDDETLALLEDQGEVLEKSDLGPRRCRCRAAMRASSSRSLSGTRVA